MTYDQYASDGTQKCPKCRKRELYYDKGVKAWVCMACRYRDR